jgi:hypothetical protein
MKPCKMLAAFALLLAAAGCRSHVIHVRLVNTSSQPISTIIVDYPRATFGKDSLAPGATFNYVIKPTDNGALKIQFADALGASHTYNGPLVQKGQEGDIEIKLTQDSISAAPALH